HSKGNPPPQCHRRQGLGLASKLAALMYITSSASINPDIAAVVTARSTTDWRAYWAAESVRIGTDWIGIAETVTAIMSRLTACPTCGAAPGINPHYCEACRKADEKPARNTQPAQTDHSAAVSTVEALMLGLRQRGVKALREAAVQRRLSELGDQQVITVGNRLLRLKPEISRAWTAAEVQELFKVRQAK